MQDAKLQAVGVVAMNAMPLVINETDLPQEARNVLTALQKGDKVFGRTGDLSLDVVVAEFLPKAIAARVRSIVPDGFQVAELEFKMSVEGKLFGCGVAGDVTVKLAPSR